MYIDGKKYYTYDITKNFDNGASGMNGFNTQLHLEDPEQPFVHAVKLL